MSVPYDEFTGGLEDEFTGGWLPKDYLTGLPIEVYENKRGKKYYSLDKYIDSTPALKGEENEAARDEQLRRIYLSAKMMKWHPLITKDLRKNFSLLASAALRGMSPDAKFRVKKFFNSANGAVKELRKRTKDQRMPYGPINKRNIARKAAFWNELIDLNLDNEEDVAKIPALLNGYYPPQFTKAELGYKPNGLIGRSDNYDAYKTAMQKIRDDRKAKRELLSEKEKMLIRARMKLWNAGKKAVREKLKAIKEQLENDTLELGMDRFKTEKLGDYYVKAWNAERARAPDFYKGVTQQELINELVNPSGKSWFQKGWEAANANEKRTKSNIPLPDVWHGVDLTRRRDRPELVEGPLLLTNGDDDDDVDFGVGSQSTGETQQSQTEMSEEEKAAAARLLDAQRKAAADAAKRPSTNSNAKRKSAEQLAREEAAKITGSTNGLGWGWGWY